jgi:hypothetical protein
VVNLANPPVSVSINTPTPGVTYTIAAGTTMTFVTSGTVFNGATFSSPAGDVFPLSGVTGYIVNDVGELPSTTYTSIATYSDWPNTTTPTFPGGSVDTGLTGITYAPGDVSWTGGEITYVPGTTFYLYFTAATDNQTSEEITVTSGATMTISSPFDFLTGVTLTTTGIGYLPTGSEIEVASRQFINAGAISATYAGAPYGGGGGIGGGSPALVSGVTGMTYGTSTNEFAGGGGGAYQHSGSVAVIQVEPGVANRSYVNTFNRNGAYGAGGTAGAGGTQYLILQTKTDSGVIPPALTVYGDESVSGGIAVGGTATANSLVVYGNGQINQNFLQNGNSGPGFGATFNSPLYATAGLSVTGGITATGNITGLDVIATSDIRSKENIVTIDSALDRVMKLRGVFYERRSQPGERRVGVIAQEVEEVLPEVVYTDDDGTKSVSYGSIIGLLIEAIKEQNKTLK